MNTRIIILLLFLVSIISGGLIQSRVKRQWGGWGGGPGGWGGGPGGWQQPGFQQKNWNKNMNRNHIAAKQDQYNCQTSGINLIGLPISSYNCRNSGMSANVNALQQSHQSQGMMQGPLAGFGGLLNNFMG
ncbi:uncharacterized protein CELE_F32G8.3 [Caenorhabditis elegans]|uniref:Uncharacterized protein n=1 Tax=Caenorhabditis elegans TaxID=6239 RepID=Q19977_CAEEL|nr:Uncharacterized protein CELE_F32G8.3 [Caenorhabditis elegans]CAA96647.1 Uncharacterized protein CELE_F32G8.3 [Caenorhabditis elegans]|eukprot:NP_505707.1 Uncharacterized protein CELE_F32G8.3 [Caenorhabditis elegans]